MDKLLRFFATADLFGIAKAALTKGKVIFIPREGCTRAGIHIKNLLTYYGVEVKDMFVLTKQNQIRLVVDDYDRAIEILNQAHIKRA